MEPIEQYRPKKVKIISPRTVRDVESELKIKSLEKAIKEATNELGTVKSYRRLHPSMRTTRRKMRRKRPSSATHRRPHSSTRKRGCP
jgi:hypothetical protein